MLFETFKHHQSDFQKIIINRKKKLAMRKVDEEDFTTVFTLIAIDSF